PASAQASAGDVEPLAAHQHRVEPSATEAGAESRETRVHAGTAPPERRGPLGVAIASGAAGADRLGADAEHATGPVPQEVDGGLLMRGLHLLAGAGRPPRPDVGAVALGAPRVQDRPLTCGHSGAPLAVSLLSTRCTARR